MAERAGGVRGDAALPFKLRDHSLFQGFAPANNPRYAASCILEHSGHMATAAPIVSDVLTFLYDQDKAMAKLTALEKTWGGTIEERMAANIRRYKNKAALEEAIRRGERSEEHTSELQSLMRISYAVFCLKKKNNLKRRQYTKP